MYFWKLFFLREKPKEIDCSVRGRFPTRREESVPPAYLQSVEILFIPHEISSLGRLCMKNCFPRVFARGRFLGLVLFLSFGCAAVCGWVVKNHFKLLLDSNYFWLYRCSLYPCTPVLGFSRTFLRHPAKPDSHTLQRAFSLRIFRL